MTDLHEVLSTVLNEYSSAREGKATAGIPLAKRIRGEYRDVLASLVDDPEKKVDSSAGKGNLANIPWFSVFDVRLTNSAQRGIYLVYLFKKDGTGVYLSLNQGWTFFMDAMGTAPAANAGITETAAKMRSFLDERVSGSSGRRLEAIDLAAGGSDRLATGYERGNVYAIYYDADDLPDAASLKADLDEYLGMYDRLLARIGVRAGMGEGDALPVYEGIAGSCAALDVSFEGACADRTAYRGAGSDDFIGRNAVGYKPATGLIVEADTDDAVDIADEKITSQSIDAVIQYERRLLLNGDTNHLANRVARASADDGYDVRSVESEDGEKVSPLHIVVKATRGPIGTPIRMTRAELALSAGDPDTFKLYRVYGITENGAEGHYVIRGDVSNYLNR